MRRITLLTALSTVLVLALPAAAGAQFMDPVLEQYAPSSQQIDQKVKGDKGDGADGGGDDESDAAAGQPGAAGGTGVGADGDTDGGDASGAGGAGGGSGGGGDDTGRGAGGGGDPAPGEDAAAQPGAGSGLDTRLLADVPVTWFDFLAFALATAALIGTAVLLRRGSRSPRVEG